MPDLAPFKLERYFAQYEFKAPYMLSASDVESLPMSDLLALADPESGALWEQLTLGYTESTGHPALRSEIARQYTNTRAEDILVLAPEEGIFIAMHTLLAPGDEVIAIAPAYQSLHEIARWRGCRVIPWPLQLAENGWKLDLGALESSLTDRTKLLVINFPHNPTGFLPNLAELQDILDLAKVNDLYVFSDEMYRMAEYEPSRRLPAVCDLYERGISLSGMSKAYGLPGLRIGWLAARQPELIGRWQQFKDYTTICSSAPSEILALIGLRAQAAILERNIGILIQNLALAEAFFARWPDLFRWLPPDAGSIAFPVWTGPDSVKSFCQAAVDEQGVVLVPGSLFDFPGQHFRLGLGRLNFREALSRLEALLHASYRSS